MKATDLRLGNTVSVGSNALHSEGREPHYFTIRELKYDVAFFEGFYAGEYYKDLEGIPLTDEWLVKLGFEDNDGDYYFNSDSKVFNFRLNLHTNNSNNTDVWVWNFHDEVVTVLDGYVHTLQNLFFAITRQELEVKELALR